MTLVERLRAIVDALPSPASSVTFTRADLVALVEGSEESPSPPARDLTVEDVAEEVGRAPSTVRGWLIAGDLRGYKLNGRDWRIPRAALREYLAAQAGGEDAVDVPEEVDISAWRRVNP